MIAGKSLVDEREKDGGKDGEEEKKMEWKKKPGK